LNKKKIIIGTAQFGLDYGISNILGKTGEKEVKKILLYGKRNNITHLDTSFHYGNAETLLGKLDLMNWEVTTKYKTEEIIKGKKSILNNLIDLIEKSKKKLKVKRIYCVLLHNPDLILKKYGNELYESLNKAKNFGLISNFGYSIYNFSNLKKICKKYKPDIIQCPYNVFDRRLVNKGYLNFLKKEGIKTHVRSVFLQGLLLMPLNKIPKFHKKWRNLFYRWEQWLNHNKLSSVEACLNFVFQTGEINKFILGFNNLIHLKQILKTKIRKKIKFPKYILSNDEKLINPNLW